MSWQGWSLRPEVTLRAMALTPSSAPLVAVGLTSIKLRSPVEKGADTSSGEAFEVLNTSDFINPLWSVRHLETQCPWHAPARLTR